MAPPPIPALTAHERMQNRAWLANAGEGVPEPIVRAVELAHRLVEIVEAGEKKRSQLRNELLRVMGITPKSERRKVGAEGEVPVPRKRATPEEREIRLRQRLDELRARGKRCRERSRKMAREIKRLEDKLKASEDADDTLEAEDPEQARRETDAVMERLACGGGVDPTLVTAREALMTGECVTMNDEVRPLAVPAELLGESQVIRERIEERVRYDFSLALHRVVLQVEKKVILDAHGERRIISASTATIGPPRFSVTWEFMVNVVILVVLYALPMNRLARMLSSEEKRFSASALSKMTRHVAEHFAPVYLQLFDELADTSIVMGDDTSPRVLEVAQHFAEQRPAQDAVWHSWPKRNAPVDPMHDADESLSKELARELGFCFPRRNGDGNKESLNTTVLAGRSHADESTSFIVFYRTHLGGFGNLLEVLLERRDPTKTELIVQTDLSTVNLVSDPKLRERFTIRQVGCSAHARRPFARFEHEDPELCEMMLSHFGALAVFEEALDECGRNPTNVAAVRDVDEREVWEDIFLTAEIVAHKWSRSSKLGEAARYILRHKDALCAYLDDPRLSSENNLSERMLRMEKQIQASSMFRVSLEGRFALDILRSICQTAIAAQVPVADYLNAVLRTPIERIREAPEKFTPRGWARSTSQVST